MAWKNIQLGSIIPSPVAVLPTTLGTVFDGINTVLDATSKAASLVSLVSSLPNDPSAIVVQTAIAEVSKALEEILTTHAGVHYLNVPIVKTSSNPIVPILPSGKWDIAGTVASGGNAGFYNTIASAINDGGDIHRPQYGEDDYITAAVVMVGAETIGQVLDTLIRVKASLGDMGTGIDAHVLPTPRNVKVVTSPSLPEHTDKVSFGAVLEWENGEDVVSLSAYGGGLLRKVNVNVYKSDKPITRNLTQTELVALKVSTSTYTPLNTSYVDISPYKDKPTYYAVAYSLASVGVNGGTTNLTNVVISDCAKLDNRIATRVSSFARGTPPDWQSLGTPLMVIPQLAQSLEVARAAVEGLSSNVSQSSPLSRLTSHMGQQSQRSTALVNDVKQRLTKLKEALSLPQAGVYATTVSGKGGVNYFLNSLAAALNSEEAGSPQFRLGTEPVGGFVILAGAGSYSGLAAVDALIKLFGGSSNTDPIAKALDTINRVPATPQSDAPTFPKPKPVIC